MTQNEDDDVPVRLKNSVEFLLKEGLISQEDYKKREERLNKCESVLLYHQTSQESAKSILNQGKFRCGSRGIVGGGIYFATSAEDTNRKAHSRGVILTATVKLGNVIKFKHSTVSILLCLLKDYNLKKLITKGYDSVEVILPTGIEYCIYDYSQISNIRLYNQKKDEPTKHDPYIELLKHKHFSNAWNIAVSKYFDKTKQK